MTEFTIPRGQARALFASLLPHAGKQSDGTPDYGRVRFAPRADELLAWTVDGVTVASGYVDVIDHTDAGADFFDLSIAALRAALAVFQGPKDKDARQMWDDRPLQVLVGSDVVVLTEVEEIIEGRSLTVERWVTLGEDRYPDVPRLLSAATVDAEAPVARVSAEAIARFIPSAKAWDGEVFLSVTRDPARVEVRIGRRFLGLCPLLRDPEVDDVAPGFRAWHDRLSPLRRPEKPPAEAAPVGVLTLVPEAGEPT